METAGDPINASHYKPDIKLTFKLPWPQTIIKPNFPGYERWKKFFIMLQLHVIERITRWKTVFTSFLNHMALILFRNALAIFCFCLPPELQVPARRTARVIPKMISNLLDVLLAVISVI
nr:hypothetical protein [Acidocella facilis]